MKFWPEVHWSEGQFLRPHHMQAAFRQLETLRGAVLDAVHPYAWGWISLDLAPEAIENHIIEIRACTLRLPEGTYVKVPDNCTLNPREFKAAFDSASGPLTVYFGVPKTQAVRANVQSPGMELDGRNPRYVVDLVERYDENTGENPQAIEVRRFRGAVFLGDEDRTGFECVPVGKIERAAAGPALVRGLLPARGGVQRESERAEGQRANCVPPLLALQAWPPLCAALDTIWNDIRARCEQLGGDASERKLTFAEGSPGDIEQLVKLHALNELTTRFGALVGCPESHPYALYLLLCEAIGKLALWDDARRPRELPPYEHGDCGPVFEELFRYLLMLVQKMLPRDYIERPFEQEEGGYGVVLDAEWFTPNHEMYLGMQSRMQLEEILARLRSINFKLASPRDASRVYEGRLAGLEFKSAGTVPNLPQGADRHYFRITRTPPYWEHCERERGVFIRMPPADMPKVAELNLALFVVKLRA